MDDIDRCFRALKRIDFKTLRTKIPNGPIMNPYTGVLEYTTWDEKHIVLHGWTLNEANNELDLWLKKIITE